MLDGAPDPDANQVPSPIKRDDNEEDIMRDDGDAEPDEDFDDYTLLTSRACVLDPSDDKRAYFFFDNRYVVIESKPGATDDTVPWGSKPLVGNWPSLVKAGFGIVDAVLPNPKNEQEMYFFYMDRYVLINIMPGTTENYIVNGPHKITADWPSLSQAGFGRVDAVLPNPANEDEAYFFCGQQYALIKIKPGTRDDVIVTGPKAIWDGWPSLKQAGFQTVDTILPNPSNRNKAYFFSGDNYALIDIRPGTADDFILDGPKLIGNEWPALQKAGFW